MLQVEFCTVTFEPLPAMLSISAATRLYAHTKWTLRSAMGPHVRTVERLLSRLYVTDDNPSTVSTTDTQLTPNTAAKTGSAPHPLWLTTSGDLTYYTCPNDHNAQNLTPPNKYAHTIEYTYRTAIRAAIQEWISLCVCAEDFSQLWCNTEQSEGTNICTTVVSCDSYFSWCLSGRVE